MKANHMQLSLQLASVNCFLFNAHYCISNIDDFEAHVEPESQPDSKNELANLDFSTTILNVKPKKQPLGIKLLQDLPNGKKKVPIFQMEQKHWGVTALHPPC